ncbi:MAG: hypothetical protein LBN24_10505 [Mediterranea sp.]|jgi:Leucine-rich repeat (LRR) protein|nr:hypothetical protein [Mediterranea sp.]
MRKKVWFVLSVALLLATACKDDKENPVAYTLEVTSDIPEVVPKEGGTYELTITSNTEWTAESSDPQWLTIGKREGDKLPITIAANDGSGEEAQRSAMITVKANDFNDLNREVKVTQFIFIEDILQFVPDANFRRGILNNPSSPDVGKDGKVSEKEALTIIEMDCAGQEIENLTGIEYFANMQRFSASDNYIKEVDITKNQKLVKLDLNNNELTDIKLDKNPALQVVYVSDNPGLKNIDISQNKELVQLAIRRDTGIKELDVSANSKIAELYMKGCHNLTIKFLSPAQKENLRSFETEADITIIYTN